MIGLHRRTEPRKRLRVPVVAVELALREVADRTMGASITRVQGDPDDLSMQAAIDATVAERFLQLADELRYW